tara:strand:+ start:68 stop:742 length:675 start_codon:yes stop_codon:yes gene_type:complete
MIYPTQAKKYSGGLYKSRNGLAWIVKIYRGDVRIYKTKPTYEDAFEFLKTKNIEHNLPIKNMIEKVDDYFEVALSQNKNMKFDEQDLNLVQSHTLCCNTGYAATRVGDKTVQFHNIIMNFTPDNGNASTETIDHINQDSLDNRRNNLRIANRRLQMTNQGIYKNNTSGVKGVTYSNQRDAWSANWQDNDGKFKSKSFAIAKYENAKQLAIDYRTAMIAPLPHYD